MMQQFKIRTWIIPIKLLKVSRYRHWRKISRLISWVVGANLLTKNPKVSMAFKFAFRGMPKFNANKVQTKNSLFNLPRLASQQSRGFQVLLKVKPESLLIEEGSKRINIDSSNTWSPKCSVLALNLISFDPINNTYHACQRCSKF